MKKIGIISDTHGFLDPKVKNYFSEVDEIWHAGDIGSLKVTDGLQNISYLRGVFGNIDDTTVRSEFPEFQFFVIEDVPVLMLHIAGRPDKYSARAIQLIEEYKPKILVCGHSHILLVKMSTKYNLLHINPGAAGNKGFHGVKTLLRFEIDGSSIQKMEVIEMGSRNSANL